MPEYVLYEKILSTDSRKWKRVASTQEMCFGLQDATKRTTLHASASHGHNVKEKILKTVLGSRSSDVT